MRNDIPTRVSLVSRMKLPLPDSLGSRRGNALSTHHKPKQHHLVYPMLRRICLAEAPPVTMQADKGVVLLLLPA